MNDSTAFLISSIWLFSFGHWIGGLISLVLGLIFSLVLADFFQDRFKNQ